MTIGTTTNRVSFNTDGVTTVFPVNLQSYLASDFTAILTNTVSGVETTLVLNSDYSLAASGTLAPTYWTLTRVGTVWAAGQTLQVFTNPTQTHQTQYQQGQAFPSLAVETDFDRLTQMVQRLQDQISRSVRAPDGDVLPAMILPTAVSRANKALIFDSSGNPSSGVVPTVTFTQSIWDAYLAASTALFPRFWPRSRAEIAAGVTPVNFGFGTSPHDVRRYGFVGDGNTDDSSAWSQLALVMNAGGNGYVPPGPTFVSTQITFVLPSLTSVALFGYGVQLYTNNSLASPYGNVAGAGYAIDALRFSGGGNSDGLVVYGITYNQVDSLVTGGLCIYQGSSVTLQDCACLISSTVAANAGFACVEITTNYPTNTFGFWNKVINFDTRQVSGSAPNYAPFGVLLVGVANATTIRDCKFTSVNYAVGLYPDPIGSIANAVLIDSNHFEGGVNAVIVNGLSIVGSLVAGLRIVNNRAESLTGGFLLLTAMNNAYPYGSFDPPWLAGNALVSSAFPYVTQTGTTTVLVNSLDFNVVSSAGLAGMMAMYTNQPLTLRTVASTGSLDVFDGQVQSAGAGLGSGYVLRNASGTVVATMAWNGTTGCFTVGANKVLGAQITGYGTPTGGSHQASFAAGSITLANLAAAVAQLIVDLKTHGMLGT